MRAALEASFRKRGWSVRTAHGRHDALATFRAFPCPLVVTDMRMPDGSGIDVMQGIRAIAPKTAIIVLTAFGTVPDAVAAMQQGASDYLLKPVSFEQLHEKAERAVAGIEGIAEEPLAGTSPIFRAVLQRARQAAATDADILIEAESGTGKEVLARFIHRTSPRARAPFVAVNCAAFPETLLESELFGHVKGAFTGATAAKPGKFELANGGTLLLDEVGEMPLSLQPKLLRVLQEREVDRLGDTHPVRVNVRVIATTNRSLRDLVSEGKFRADLYYRLHVIPLAIPPLRERSADIPVLAEYFLRRYAPANRGPVRFSSDLLERLRLYNWPGNVRELENFVRRALVLSAGPVIGAEALEDMGPSREWQRVSALQAGLTLREAERQLLLRTLEATGGNRTRAASMMGISLRTIRNKIREYGLPRRETFAKQSEA